MNPSRWCARAIATAVMWVSASAFAATPAAVDPPDDATAIIANADLLLEASVLTAQPAFLQTGQTVGAGAGIHSTGWLSWGVVTSLSQSEEGSLSHAVAHLEWRTRLAATALLQRGRGAWLLQAALGGTLINETRLRHQSLRLTGKEDATSAWRLLPSAEVMAGVRLRAFEGWGVSVAVGPTWHLLSGDSKVTTGFAASVGVLRWL